MNTASPINREIPADICDDLSAGYINVLMCNKVASDKT